MENSLTNKRPNLVESWHPTKNGKHTTDTVAYSSNKKYWWVCDKGHEWEASANKRSIGRGCPYCSGNLVLSGFNDLETVYPEVSELWHPSKNKGMKPSQAPKGGSMRVWWIGECGHEWEKPINWMTRGNLGEYKGCPFCSGKKVLVGFNDLSSQYPEVAKQWSEKNELSAEDVTPKSNKPAVWECEAGHEWTAPPNNRTRKFDKGCPMCNGYKVIPGGNDLGTLRPSVAREYSTRNTTPVDQVSVGSDMKVEWVCSEGHTWVTNVYNRTKENGTGCPECSMRSTTSKAEQEISEFLKGRGVISLNNVKDVLKRREIDIYISFRKVGIEYNGLYWHSEKFLDKNYHYEKSKEAEKAGVQLLHIWEDDWLHRRPVVERMIARKLGVSKEPRYNARSLELGKVTAKEARTFLEDNHIQGFTTGSWYGTLQDDQGIKALLVMRKTNKKGEFYLDRFATSGIVRGGFSKLFKAFVKEFHPSKITTFSDTGVSDGSLYEKLGFEEDGELEPDYSYIVSGRRVHKFRYRKSKFKNDPTLKYEEGKTERELAEMNGLLRVYDAGKVRWEWKP